MFADVLQHLLGLASVRRGSLAGSATKRRGIFGDSAGIRLLTSSTVASQDF
jgi:hypothetical protein